MAERPRLGDRARRHDDRAAFLDALLCAREVLYLSYPGHNVRDDSPLPPAIPVSELLDYLGRSVAGGADAVRRRLITEHRLQPWSPHYFRRLSEGGLSGETGALFSYAAEYAEVARRARTDLRSAARPLFIHPLPEPGPEWRQVEINRLIDFFSHPIRFLLRERLASISAPERPSCRIKNPLNSAGRAGIPAGRATPAAVPRGYRGRRDRRDRGNRPGRQRVAPWRAGPHRAAKRVAGTGPVPRRPHPPWTHAYPC